MELWFTSRAIYDREYNFSDWQKYVKWSRLNQLTELVSLDGSLNNLTFNPDFENDIDEIIIDKTQVIQFFKSIKYVEAFSNHLDYYNLLAVVQNPSEKKQCQLDRDFEFIGYDLLEKEGDISALVNCGGFDETFLPKEQNQFGLITEYVRAREIVEQLSLNNPNENHADCHLYEVWRHKFKGRNSFNEQFCSILEHNICETLKNTTKQEIKGFWCDGIVHKRIAKKKVNDNRKIVTSAYIGKDSQSKYILTIELGNKSLSRFAKGRNMTNCIPNNIENWIEVKPINKEILIHLY